MQIQFKVWLESDMDQLGAVPLHQVEDLLVYVDFLEDHPTVLNGGKFLKLVGKVVTDLFGQWVRATRAVASTSRETFALHHRVALGLGNFSVNGHEFGVEESRPGIPLADILPRLTRLKAAAAREGEALATRYPNETPIPKEMPRAVAQVVQVLGSLEKVLKRAVPVLQGIRRG